MSLLHKFSSSTSWVTVGLSLIQLFKACFSIFTVILSSIYFGTSLDRDVWLLSLSIMAIIGALIFGPVYQIFRVKLIMIKEEEGEEKALKSIGSLLVYMMLLSMLIILLAEIFPSLVSKIFDVNYTDEQQHFFKIMVRLIAPTLLFSVFTIMLSGVLNVYKTFYIPEVMSVLSIIINVVIILLFAPGYGIYSLIISSYLSNVIFIIVLLLALKKNKIDLIKNLNLNFSYIMPFIKFALPFYLNYFIAQVLLVVERILSVLIGVGSVSVLDYARKFSSIPIDVIQGSGNAILATTLTEKYITEGEISFILEVNKFMNLMLIILLPIVTIFVICPVEIVNLFLLHGAFDPKFVLPTANSLFWFGFGVVSIIFFTANSYALMAQVKNKNLVIISGIIGFVILIINLLFYKKYGIQVLAFSWSIAHFIGGVFMYFIISFKEYKLLFKEFFRKMALIFIVLIISLVIYNVLLTFFTIENLMLKSLTTMVVVGVFSITLELLFIYVLRFKEKIIIENFIASYVFKDFNLRK